MKKIFLVLILFLLLGCEKQKEITNDEHYINIINSEGDTETLMLEEYIIGVVGGEMPALFNSEALKAQAIAARSYALYRKDQDILVTDFNQVYLNEEQLRDKWGNNFIKYYNLIYDAVNETSDLVLKYNNEVIDALYFSSSNGFTENSEDVYDKELPYLRSVEIEMDYLYEDNSSKQIIDKDDLLEKLNINEYSFEILEKTIGNSVKKVQIGNKIFHGAYIRSVLSIKSQDFTFELDENNVIITTKGYGHQVGLSQWGSNFLANDGYKYDEILNFFYTNVKILKI